MMSQLYGPDGAPLAISPDPDEELKRDLEERWRILLYKLSDARSREEKVFRSAKGRAGRLKVARRVLAEFEHVEAQLKLTVGDSSAVAKDVARWRDRLMTLMRSREEG